MERQRSRCARALSPLDDPAVIEQMAAGDSDALEELYHRYGRLVFNIALRITGDRSSSEEVTQDVFLRLWQHARHYQPMRGSGLTWIATIAQRRALDELRYRRGRRRRVEVVLAESIQDPAGLDFSSLAQLRTDLQHALAELPAAQREIIELNFFEGFDRKEIAQQTQKPLGTIHSRIRLGLDKLRLLLGPEEQQVAPALDELDELLFSDSLSG